MSNSIEAKSIIPALTAFIDPEGIMLTPDALMAYCGVRMRSLDTSIREKMIAQQNAAKTQTDISKVLQDLGKLYGTDSDWDVQNDKPNAHVHEMAKVLLDKANDSSLDPALRAKLKDIASSLVRVKEQNGVYVDAAWNGQGWVNKPDGFDCNCALSAEKHTVSDIKDLVDGPLKSLQSDLQRSTELDMIQLQSLMSQRQSAVQMCTNLVQALGDQVNKITANIGH